MKEYSFIIDLHDKYSLEDYDQWERIEICGWYPSRLEAQKAAADYSNQHKQFGLYVDWINELDENGVYVAQTPFGDYEDIYGDFCADPGCIWDEIPQR